MLLDDANPVQWGHIQDVDDLPVRVPPAQIFTYDHETCAAHGSSIFLALAEENENLELFVTELQEVVFRIFVDCGELVLFWLDYVHADPEPVCVDIFTMLVAEDIDRHFVIEVTMHNRRNTIQIAVLRAEDLFREFEALHDPLGARPRQRRLVSGDEICLV